MVTAPLLPVLALATLTDPAGTHQGMLAAARRGRTLHALTDTGRTLTPSGRVRRTARPLCGRRPRAWRPASVDGRPLCRTCARVLATRTDPAVLAQAARQVSATDLAVTLLTASDARTVNAARGLLIESGQTAKSVQLDRGGPPVRLTALVAQASTRVQRGPLPMTEADRAWISLVQRAPLGRSRPARRRVS